MNSADNNVQGAGGPDAIRGGALVAGAFIAFLAGVFGLGLGTAMSITSMFYVVLTAAPVGVLPVVLAALCGIPLIRYLHNVRAPLLAQALAFALSAAAVCSVVAGTVYAISGQGLPAFVAAPVAAWCGFFGPLIGRVLQSRRSLFVGGVAFCAASVASGVILRVIA